MIGDSEVATLLSKGLVRGIGGEESESLAYTAHVVSRFDGQIEIELRQNGEVARTRLALPGSGRPTPWITSSDPGDTEDWVGQLVIWLDEEMFTGGLGPALYREPDGEVYTLVVDGYGFRRCDPVDHQRLRTTVGPHGYQDARLSHGAIKKQYAAEWALDTVEQLLRKEPSELKGLPEPSLKWSLRSPNGVSILVAAELGPDDGKEVGVELKATAGLGRQPSAHRHITAPPQSSC